MRELWPVLSPVARRLPGTDTLLRIRSVIQKEDFKAWIVTILE